MQVEIVVVKGCTGNDHQDAEIVKVTTGNANNSKELARKFAEYLWLNASATFFRSLKERMIEIEQDKLDVVKLEYVKRI